MDFPDNLADLGLALNSFIAQHAAALPEDTRMMILEAAGQPSPVVTMVSVGELLYARRDEVGDEGKTLAAQLISFATMNGWHGLTVDARGTGIVSALRRELGEAHPSGEWPAPEEDPEPKTVYVREEAEPAPEPPVEE